MMNLGTLPGYTGSYGNAINDGGEVVGDAYSSAGTEEAFLYTSASGMQGLGTLGGLSSIAYGINDAGEIVGYADTVSGTDAFLYYGGIMIDLGPDLPGWSVTEATGINDSGQIVGYGINPLGQHDSFLLTPVPELSSVLLVFSGLIGMIGLAKRTPIEKSAAR
jgi:probable HAF family extracellular repeat protein